VSLGASITVAITALVALVGYLATYTSNRWLAQRESRLERINTQLSELYGPLLADLEGGNAAWDVFQEIAERLGPRFWETGDPPNSEQAPLWQLWIQTVFQPRNRRMADHIQTHVDLLLEDEMPPSLVTLIANTAAYDVLAARWQGPHFPGKNREDYLVDGKYAFPRPELDSYVPSSFRALKLAQRDLLGKLRRDSGPET